MGFNKEDLDNKMYMDTALTFDKICVEGTNAPENIGVERTENGDSIIRLYLPGVEDLKIVSQFQGELPYTRNSNGLIEAVLPYSPDKTGPQTLDIVVDGNIFLCPYLPIYWTGNRPCNFVEVPDPDNDYCRINEVEHGFMSHTVFRSEATKNWERCNIYLPASYMLDTKDYPVIYLLNGGTDNETSWEYSGRMAYITDNLLAKGEAVPAIVVMMNAMLRYDGKISGTRDLGLDEMITKDLIPFIESHFRVKTDKWDRAIAGLSMGSYMSCDIAFSHPDLFGSLGTFTACMTTGEQHEIYTRPYPEYIKDADRFGQDFKLFFRSTTPMEDHFEWFLDDDKLCEKYGIDKLPGYHRTVFSDTTSKWNSWRMGWREFAKLVFKD